MVKSNTACCDRPRLHFYQWLTWPSLFANYPLSKISSVAKGTIKVNVRSKSALAYLLLLTMAYGAIVEAAHSHGFSSSRPSQVTTVSNGGDSQSSYQGHSSYSDCSLCQFQRQLFGGLVDVILVAHTPQQIAFRFEETLSYLSTSALPPSGRAPPLS